MERQKSQEIFRAHTGSKQSQKYQSQTTATIKGQSTTAKSASTAATKKESDVVDHYKNNQLKILSGSHVKKSQKKEFHLRKKEESESVTESKVKTTHTAYATKQLQEKGVKTIGYNRETRKEVTQKAAVAETKQEVTADVYERVKVFARGGVIQLSLEEDDTPKMPPVPQEEMMKIRESSNAHAHYSSKQSRSVSSSYHTSQKTSSANQVALIKQQYQHNQAQQQIQHHHQQTQQQQQQQQFYQNNTQYDVYDGNQSKVVTKNSSHASKSNQRSSGYYDSGYYDNNNNYDNYNYQSSGFYQSNKKGGYQEYHQEIGSSNMTQVGEDRMRIPPETVYYSVCTHYFKPEHNDWILNVHRQGKVNVPRGMSHRQRCVFRHHLYEPDREEIVVEKIVPPRETPMILEPEIVVQQATLDEAHKGYEDDRRHSKYDGRKTNYDDQQTVYDDRQTNYDSRKTNYEERQPTKLRRHKSGDESLLSQFRRPLQRSVSDAESLNSKSSSRSAYDRYTSFRAQRKYEKQQMRDMNNNNDYNNNNDVVSDVEQAFDSTYQTLSRRRRASQGNSDYEGNDYDDGRLRRTRSFNDSHFRDENAYMYLTPNRPPSAGSTRSTGSAKLSKPKLLRKSKDMPGVSPTVEGDYPKMRPMSPNPPDRFYGLKVNSLGVY